MNCKGKKLTPSGSRSLPLTKMKTWHLSLTNLWWSKMNWIY